MIGGKAERSFWKERECLCAHREAEITISNPAKSLTEDRKDIKNHLFDFQPSVVATGSHGGRCFWGLAAFTKKWRWASREG